MDRKPRIEVVVNASGGKAARAGEGLRDQLIDAFAAQGVTVAPQLVEGKDLAATLTKQPGCDVVAVGGGDGTLGSAAALLSKAGQTMAVLPLGTLNHLSVDLGIPADLAEAAKIAITGRTRAIDLAQVGEQMFVNNASVGLYTKLVRVRDGENMPKWLAAVPAAWTALRAIKVRRLELDIGGERQVITTPLLFIGNNRYNFTGERLGQRDTLDRGELALYAVSHRSALALIGFALRTLLGRADADRDFTLISECKEFTLLGSGPIHVAHDGEVSEMMLPLRFVSLPHALKVRVPA